VSFHLPSLWTITAEVRARSIHGSGHMVDMTLGFSRHLGL
jgi:hypothetical protein